MKGIFGLIVALGLGIFGAAFNWLYLSQRSVRTADFIVIKKTVNPGERLTEAHLDKIEIPRRDAHENLIRSDDLERIVFRYSELNTVVGMPVYRVLQPSSLLLRSDLKTPPAEVRFEVPLTEGEEERGIFVPFNTKAFVPSLVNPGDIIDFILPKGGIGVPTPAGAPGAKPGDGGGPGTSNSEDIIGPFKILSVGNRLSSIPVWRASGRKPSQENVMLISVKVKNGRLEPKAQKLWNLLQRTNFQQVGFMIRPRNK